MTVQVDPFLLVWIARIEELANDDDDATARDLDGGTAWLFDHQGEWL